MKSLITIFALFSALLVSKDVFAATVKITSFYPVDGTNGKLAELCGRIEGMTEKFVIVKVTADPRSKQKGIYNVWVGPEAKFCTTLATSWGEADAEIRE